ncbi:hypothetical protein ACO22_06534 [Paracoccidioides brasiliensis]|uniref:Uncharacterized protein n=1 Tax=Paracoccidioides brasiliensis TaxID=121759 RepID=A0A1D2J776_PARBR|nr:hypothetical protein ACO22_06534 [Paracoccidioides brasiliensis]ODH45738.1 hypothetical protein GX48_08183 [Paracoccidioides brasiliensis]
MAQPSPKLSSAGVLPISASATQKGSSTKQSSKAATPRLKLLIRRLPPGLTYQEFEASLGDEWKVGNGKVDWLQFRDGKISKDRAKPSKPTRVYLRVTSTPLVEELSEKVRQLSFQDAQNTSRDPVLLGPPALEYAPYPRVPGSRVRKDGRQGTIDLDSDFIAFLESLTNPVTKTTVDISAEDAKEEKSTITPLIQFLREKKANKGREAVSPAKPSRHARGEMRESRDSKGERVHAKKLLSRTERLITSPGDRQSKVDRATKEAVKAVNKQATIQAAKPQGKTVASRPAKEESPAQATPPPERKRERGSMSAATKILRRDLGLGPATQRRRSEKSTSAEAISPPPNTETTKATSPLHKNSNKQPLSTKTSNKGAESSNNKITFTKAPKVPTSTDISAGRNPNKPTNPSTGPANFSAPSGPKLVATPAAAQAASLPSATQAFLKHANPSQGVTEELLASGFSTFGKVIRVEIDKKKGFGYVDFAEPEGLSRAIQASPVQIAQSQVVVLERKSGAAVAQARGNASSNNRASQSPTGPATRVGSGGTGPAPSRHTRRGHRGRGEFNKTVGGGGGGGANAGGNGVGGGAKKNASSA